MKQPKYLDEAFEQVLEEMLKLFVKKYKDYGKGNILDTEEMGIVFRISDKLNRLKNLLVKKKQPESETIEDSWIDIAVYGVIAIMYKRGWFKNLELKKEERR